MILRTIEDGVGTITLNRPPLNILTQAMLGALRESLDVFRDDPAVRVVVLQAEGKHFSAGADVGEHLEPQYRDLIPEFLQTVEEVANFPQPVVAAVQGRCLGGGFEIVQAADMIVASEAASFGQPEVLLGVLPPAACAMLPFLCGSSLAAELVLTGAAIPAHVALGAGLVSRLVAEDLVQGEARRLARTMAERSGATLRLAKRALRAGTAAARREALVAAERIYLDELMCTRDATEGLQAFLEKREPVWSHE